MLYPFAGVPMERCFRSVVLCFLFLVSLALTGCPHHIVQQVERIVPPKDYKPVYLTSSVPLSAFFSRYRDSAGVVRADTVWDVVDMDSAVAVVAAETPSESSDSTAVAGAPAGRSAARRSGPVSTPPAAGTASASAHSSARSPVYMRIRSVDDSRYPDEIEVRAHVYDDGGRFVMGLAPPHFAGTGAWRDYWRTLIDSCAGRAVHIDSFAVTEVRESAREPHAIAFVLDHSPSMGDQRARLLQEAVRRTLGFVTPDDYIAVVKFTRDVHVEVPISGDSAVYKNKLTVDGLNNGGYGVGTAMYDAARAGIDQVAAAPEGCKRVIVIFSDGGDNSSKYGERDIYAYAREKRVAVYTIAYGLTDEEPLYNLAAHGGGRMYRIYSSREFPYVFADIYRSLKNYYRITYRPPSCAGRHTVSAGVTFAELGGLTVMSRGRYDRSVFTAFDTVGAVVFANIEFEYGKAVVRPESTPFIRDVAEAMLASPGMTIDIRGHTDDAGSEEYNLKLSRERARAVADMLVSFGVDRTRLTVTGFGESRPLVPNTSPENARRNRRTEFVILSR